MRSILVLLLLVVFFLTGLVLGMDRGGETGKQQENTVKQEQMKDVQVITVNQQTTDEKVLKAEQPPNLTQKTASFLESTVKGFYNIVVDIIYGFIHVFFE
ncbi:hypothetical protein [Virgibacillus ihumii]|uniref:hypothetical protein n=1 Tax=Virgibacillus ihumii TaxID=2686091 RepID=UPI00157D718D|nr:hypothetical protein [Virgibacillus ihumii]